MYMIHVTYITVPDVPIVSIVPSYFNDSQALEQLFIEVTMNQTVSDECAHNLSP